MQCFISTTSSAANDDDTILTALDNNDEDAMLFFLEFWKYGQGARKNCLGDKEEDSYRPFWGDEEEKELEVAEMEEEEVEEKRL